MLTSGWRIGSFWTSRRTSRRWVATKSRILLWRNETNPSFLHVRVCSSENEEPHSQFDGVFCNAQPLLILRRSIKHCLVRQYLSSSSGNVVSQDDAPVSQFSCRRRIWFTFKKFLRWHYVISHMVFLLFLTWPLAASRVLDVLVFLFDDFFTEMFAALNFHTRPDIAFQR